MFCVWYNFVQILYFMSENFIFLKFIGKEFTLKLISGLIWLIIQIKDWGLSIVMDNFNVTFLKKWPRRDQMKSLTWIANNYYYNSKAIKDLILT